MAQAEWRQLGLNWSGENLELVQEDKGQLLKTPKELAAEAAAGEPLERAARRDDSIHKATRLIGGKKRRR